MDCLLRPLSFNWPKYPTVQPSFLNRIVFLLLVKILTWHIWGQDFTEGKSSSVPHTILRKPFKFFCKCLETSAL